MYLNIAVCEKRRDPEHTHIELAPDSILSALSNCTPLSDFNQSPRNMYQCQVMIIFRTMLRVEKNALTSLKKYS